MTYLRFKPHKSPVQTDLILGSLVQLAGRSVPAYRELLEESRVSPSCVRGLSDLPALPILEKEWLFRDEDPCCRLREGLDPASCVQVRTGGYTGLPVHIYLSRAEQLFRRLQLLTEWRRLVQLPLVLHIADVGSWVEDEAGFVTVRHGPVSILRVSNALPLEQQVRLISRFAPHVVSGYPTTTALLAEAWERTALCRPPLLIATRGEVLHEAERELISNGFGSRIADFYNCEEIGNVASECAVDPGILHVNTDACVVEIVDDQGRPLPFGRDGRILLTNLYSRTMPFIRYRVGDRGALLSQGNNQRCACGSRRPKMAVIEGRDDDYVILPDGQKMSPRLVATTMKRNVDAKAKSLNRTRFFKRMQIVQDRADHLTVRVVREGEWPADLDAFISEKMCELHPSLRCTVTAVERIELESSGKFKKVARRMDESGS